MLKKIIIVICLSSFLFNLNASNIIANSHVVNNNRVNVVNNRSLSLAIALAPGVINAVGPYILGGLASAGLAYLTADKLSSFDLQAHKDNIQIASLVAWDLASTAVKNEILGSWENAVNAGSTVVELSDYVLNWFSGIFTTQYAGTIHNLLQDYPVLNDLRFSDTSATFMGGERTDRRWSVFLTNFVGYDHMARNYVRVPTSWRILGFEPSHASALNLNLDAQGQMIDRFGFEFSGTLTNALPTQSIVEWTVGINGRDLPIFNTVSWISFVESRMPLLRFTDVPLALDILNGLPAQQLQNIDDIVTNSDRMMDIPIGQFNPSLDGRPITFDPDAGAWVWEGGIPINNNLINDINWDMPLPGILDGVFDGVITSPDVPITVPDTDTGTIAGLLDAILSAVQSGFMSLSQALSALTDIALNLGLTLTDILTNILSFPMFLIDALVWTFAPTAGVLDMFFSDIQNAWNNRFPIFSQVENAWNVGYQNINPDEIYANIYFPSFGFLDVKIFSADALVRIVPTFKLWFSVFLYFLTFIFLARKTSRILSEGKG